MPFPYKTVLITGATSGIGQALAERMIDAGIYVIAVGRRQDRLDAFVAKHGSTKVSAEAFDVSDIAAIPEWTKKITSSYPKLDCIILNAGFQRSMDFTNPSSISISSAEAELRTNYLSPVATVTAFLPHLTSLAGPAGIYLVSSGLALVPITRCPNYCASKTALHSFAWTLRSQLEGSNVRVVEIMPPAVQTELHTQQADLVAMGDANFGLPLDAYTDETWGLMTQEEELDEVVVKEVQNWLGPVDVERKKLFRGMVEMMRAKEGKFGP